MRDSTKELIAEYENFIALMKREDGVTQFECKRLTDPSFTPWGETVAPSWHFDKFEYRLKPKPAKLWIWKYPNGKFGSGYDNKQPDDTGTSGRVMVLMKEVTE